MDGKNTYVVCLPKRQAMSFLLKYERKNMFKGRFAVCRFT